MHYYYLFIVVLFISVVFNLLRTFCRNKKYKKFQKDLKIYNLVQQICSHYKCNPSKIVIRQNTHYKDCFYYYDYFNLTFNIVVPLWYVSLNEENDKCVINKQNDLQENQLVMDTCVVSNTKFNNLPFMKVFNFLEINKQILPVSYFGVNSINLNDNLDKFNYLVETSSKCNFDTLTRYKFILAHMIAHYIPNYTFSIISNLISCMILNYKEPYCNTLALHLFPEECNQFHDWNTKNSLLLKDYVSLTGFDFVPNTDQITSRHTCPSNIYQIKHNNFYKNKTILQKISYFFSV